MNKKNVFKRLIMTLLCCALLAGIGLSATACANKGSSQKNRTKFTIGFDAEFPPYGYDNGSGEYVGFDLDLAAEVAKRNGWELVKQPIEWNSKDLELSTGAIDCIWSGFTINGRQADYTWSKAYVDNSQVVVVKNSSDIKAPEDLVNKIVAVQADSSALSAFTAEDASEENLNLAHSMKELTQVGDYNSAFLNLESGAVDAICMDTGVASYEVKTRAKKGVEYRILEQRISSEQYGIGFKKGNVDLRDAVQKSLDDMLADGTFDQIAKKWSLEESVCLGQLGTDEAYLQDDREDISTGLISRAIDIAGQLLSGMLATIEIFLLTLTFSLPLGFLLMRIRACNITILSLLARIYISIMRGTPLMLQLLVVFFGPYYILGINVSTSFRFYAVIIGFSLNYAAYFAEIFRAGVEGIPQGQTEAAQVLGYSQVQKTWKIIFPQMVKRVLPPVTNEIITLVKDTSLAFALAYTEVFTLAKQVSAADASIFPLFIAGIFYYVFNALVAWGMSKVENALKYYD